MTDPTYVKAEIDAKPQWSLAFRLSEVHNDNAPIGWSHYIGLASWLLNRQQRAADRIVRRVAELPDRTSPDDWPKAMLVTADELHDIVTTEGLPGREGD